MAESSGIERVLQRIRSTVEDGSYYEAQQMYKTVYHRYKAKKMITDCFRVLEDGACIQLEKGQINCGTELGNLLLEGYEEEGVELEQESVNRLRSIVVVLPKPESHAELNAQSAEVEEGSRFLSNVIRWIRRKNIQSEYFLEFNSFVGDYLMAWEGCEVLGRITIFYARGRNWTGLSKALISCLETSDLPDEEDLFICRCVLQLILYATEENIQGAHEFLETYTKSRALPETPLIHFVQFLIEALEIPSDGLMTLLRSKYDPVLRRDLHLNHLLDKIHEDFFPTRNNNLISNLLGGILQNSTS